MKIKVYILWILHTCKLFYRKQKLQGKNITLGANFSCGMHFRCEAIEEYDRQRFHPKIIFGSNVHVEDFVHIGCTNRVEIGDNTVIASKVYISDHNHGYYDDEHTHYHENPKETPPLLRKLTNNGYIKVGKNVWIGENVTILPGSIIGDGAIVGANSVVKGTVEEYTISVGVPARCIKKYNFETDIWVGINEN